MLTIPLVMLTVSNISAGVYSDDVNVFGEIVLSETYPTPSLGSTLVVVRHCTHQQVHTYYLKITLLVVI